MMGTTTITELRWQCRRGMLELDILLNNFVDSLIDNRLADSNNESGENNKNGEHNGCRLTQQKKKSFELLLSYPDQTLLDLLLGNAKSSNPEISSIIKQIQATSSN